MGETAATGLWAQIEALASQVVADLEGQITDLGDAIAGGDLTDSTYTTLLSISNALETLNGAGDSSVAGQIATAIGQPTVGETAATGLWAQIEALASQVVADLEDQITDLGDAIAGGDLTDSTYTTLLSISNALETLNGAGDSSVAGQIATVIGQPTVGETAATGLWAQIEALASQVVADLEGQITDLGDAIAGGDLTDATYTTLLSISNALETLNGAGDSSVAGQIATAIGQPTVGETAATGLWAQIEALASQVVADLEGQITDLGDAITGGDLTESTYTTLLSISNALETLNGAGDSSVAGQIATAIGQPSVGESAATGLYLLIETSLTTAIADLEQKIQGEGVAEADFTTLAALESAIEALGTTSGADIEALETAVGVADDGEGNATGLYLLIETSLATAITDLEQKIQGEGVAEADFTTLAALESAIEALGTTSGADIEALETAVGVADDGEGNATGLYLLIETSLATAITDLEQKIQGEGVAEADFTTLAALNAAISALGDTTGADIAALETAVGVADDGEGNATGLYLLIETSLVTAITDLEQKILGDTFNSAEDYATLEALSDAIDALQISSGANLSDLEARVGEPATTDTPASGLYAEIAKLQDSIDAINAVLQPAEIQGNELDNFIQMYPYSTQTQTIRVEAGAGDDRVDGANVNSQIVGGEGADVINLTYLDQSQDSVVYQDVSDGRVLNAVKVSFSTDRLDYREGSVLTLTINGSEYSYTVATDGGTSMADALEGFASSLRADLFAPDPATTVVGLLWSLDDLYADAAAAPASEVTLADLGEDGIYQVPAGMLMIPISSYTADPGSILSMFGAALSGGATFTATTEQVYDLSSVGGNGPVFATEAWVEGYLAGSETSLTPADLLMASTDVVTAVTVADDSLVIYGLPGETVTVEAGGDTEAAIENAGMATQYEVTFSSEAADWPTPTNEGNTTIFDRSLSVTINNGTKDVVVTADVAFDTNGVADQAASISNLATSVNDHADLTGVVTASASGNTLTLTADVITATDEAAPTFTVASASVEKNGVQQETLVEFSNDPADYYAGGTLSVTVANVEVTADMVAGDPAASVAALKAAIQLATEGESIYSFAFDFVDLSDNPIAMTEGTALSSSLSTSRYTVDITLDGEQYNVSVAGDGTVMSGAGVVVSTIGELLSELNTVFNGVGVFALDGNSITLTTTANVDVSSSSSISLVLEDSANNYPQSSASIVFESDLSTPAGLDGVLESAVQGTQEVQLTETTVTFNYDVWINENTALNTDVETTIRYTVDLDIGGVSYYRSVSADGTVYDVDKGVIEGEVGATDIKSLVAELNLAFKDVAVFTFYDAPNGEGTDSISFTTTSVVGENPEIILLPDTVNEPGVFFQPEPVFSETYFPGIADAPTLTLTAATEALDPLQVSATLGYEGEYQLATLSLEDAVNYTAFADGTDLTGINRGAEVYYEGGKVYLTITGFGADKALGGVDDVVHTINADMGVDTTATLNNLVLAINAETSGSGKLVGIIGENGASASEGTITLTAANPGKETFNVTDVTLDYQGVKQLATFSLDTATDYTRFTHDNTTLSADRGADVYFEGGKAYLTITDLGTQTPVTVSADMVQESGTIAYVRGSVDFTATSIEVQFPDPYVAFSEGGIIYFRGEETVADFLDHLNADARVMSARIETSGPEAGNIIIESVPGVEIIEVFWQSFSDGVEPYPDTVTTEIAPAVSAADATSQALVDVINAATSAGGSLEGLIESAALGQDGTITLTAAQIGKDTFSITDVRLDYEGVQQLASFDLDNAATYTVSSEGNKLVDTSAVTAVLDVFEIRVADKIVNYFDALVERGTSHYTGMAIRLTFEDLDSQWSSGSFIASTGNTELDLDFASQVSFLNDKLTAKEAEVGRELGSITYENGVIRVVAAPGVSVIGGDVSDGSGLAYDLYVQDTAPDPAVEPVYYAINGNGALMAGTITNSSGPLDLSGVTPLAATNTTETITGGRGLSDVYYEGGKAYMTIAPMDNVDTIDVDESVENAVTVSADMVPNSSALTGRLANFTPDTVFSETSGGDVFISVALRDAGGNTLERLRTQDGETLADFAARVEATSAFVKSVGFAADPDLTNVWDLTFVLNEAGATDVAQAYFSGFDFSGTDDIRFVNSSYVSQSVSGAEATTQNLADAINDQISGYDLPAVAVVDAGIVDGTEDLTGIPGDGDIQRFELSYREVGDPNRTIELSVWALQDIDFPDTAFRVSASVDVYDSVQDDTISTPIGGFDISDAEYAAGVRFTLADLVDYANGLTFEGQPLPFTLSIENGNLTVTSADASNGVIDVRVSGWEADAVFGTTNLFVNESGGWTSQTYRGDITQVAPDETLSALLESAAVAEDGSILLTGKDTATQTFTVSDVKLDYQGVQQMAQAKFSTVDADYFTGGDLRIGVTPVDGTEVVISADMVDGNAAQSIQNLVDAINDKIVTTVPSNDASVAIGGGFTDATVIHDGTSGYFLLEFFVEKDGVRQSYEADVYTRVSDAGFRVTFNEESVVQPREGQSTLGDFVAWLNTQSLPVIFSIDSTTGSIVATAVDSSLGVTVGLQVPDVNGLLVSPVVNTDPASGGFFTETATPEQQVPGELGSVLSSVTYADGVITLTSADKVKEQFSISDAEIDYLGVKQSVKVAFDADDVSYYDLSNYGAEGTVSEIGLVLNGRTFVQAMSTIAPEGLTPAEVTVLALEAQIEAARSETEQDGTTPTAYANWLNANIETVELGSDGVSIVFTAADPSSTDIINLSQSFMTVAPITQVTSVDVTGVQFDDRLTAAGEAAKISVTIAGTEIIADQGSTQAASVRNLVEQIVVARDGIGVETAGTFEDNQSLTLVNTSDLLALDPFTVTLTVAGQAVTINVDPLSLSAENGVGTATVQDLADFIASEISHQLSASGYAAQSDGQGTVSAYQVINGPSALVEINVVSLPFKTLDYTGVTADPSVSTALGALDWNGAGAFTLTAKSPGVDPLEVTGLQYEVENTTSSLGAPHIVLLSFDNIVFDDLAQTPEGTVIDVRIGGVETSVTIDSALSSEVLRSEAIVTAVKTAIEEAQIGSVQQGYLDRGTFVPVSDTGILNGDNVLQITASENGAYTLGRASDGTFSVTVTSGGEDLPLAVTAGVTQIGDIDYDFTNVSELITDVQVGRDEGLVTETVSGDPVFSIGGVSITDDSRIVPSVSATEVDGEADDPKDQTLTNPDPIDYPSFYGDAPQLVEDQTGTLTDDGVRQSFTNPDSEYTATSGSAQTGDIVTTGGDATYYGDAALFGEDGSGTLTGDGVLQSFTNPDSEYTATSGSPASGTVDTAEGAGDSTFSGDDERLGADGVDQTYTNPSSGYDALPASPESNTEGGNTGDSNLEGIAAGSFDENDVLTFEDASPTATGDKIDLGDGSTTGDGGVAGEAETSITDTTSDSDAFEWSQLETGFAAYEWDSSQLTTLADTSTGFDVVNNFQVASDFIVVEGELAASTLSDNPALSDTGVEVGVSTDGWDVFDLSNAEFGLVTSPFSNVAAADLTDADLVAQLLNQVFEFNSASGGTQDNGELNTTLFGVTASDDDTVTAIWAHTQSTSGDVGIGAEELSLMAVVNTSGDTFGADNFALLDGTELRQPEILQSQLIG
ncbi:hypothetical protein [Marinobacter sp.]|uniref:beta strand repeat-containing protein n=1 Tax=Marinobacter sp. TaxID=50741 RepID=UPI002354352C|nr:hypothetical protein [Marinobacter sp.]